MRLRLFQPIQWLGKHSCDIIIVYFVSSLSLPAYTHTARPGVFSWSTDPSLWTVVSCWPHTTLLYTQHSIYVMHALWYVMATSPCYTSTTQLYAWPHPLSLTQMTHLLSLSLPPSPPPFYISFSSSLSHRPPPPPHTHARKAYSSVSPWAVPCSLSSTLWRYPI